MALVFEIDKEVFSNDVRVIDKTLADLEKSVSEIPLLVWEEIDRVVQEALAQRFEEIKDISLHPKTIQYKEEYKKLQTPVQVWADGGTATSPQSIPSSWAGRFTNTLYETVVNSGGIGTGKKGMAKEISDDANILNAVYSCGIDIDVFYMAYPRIFNAWLHDKVGIGLMYLNETQMENIANKLVTMIVGRIDQALAGRG